MMKAILTDYSHWSSARKLKYMDSVPDKYFTICTDIEDAGMGYSNFAIYDVTELSNIDSGDGETIVHLKNKKNSIYCDGVAFFEDTDDIVERYIAYLKECGYKFEVKEIKEVDVVSKREELDTRSKSVKSKIKATIREMLKSGNIVPSDISFDSDTMFKNKEDEILALGSFVYNGISSMQEYVYKKLAIEPDSVRMFNITNYEYPIVAICIKGDLLKKEHCSDISNRIEKCMNEVRCYRPPREHSYTDIDFTWDDVGFYFKAPEDAYFLIYHYRPESFEDREAEKKNINMAVSEGLKMTRVDDNVDINMPTDVHTTAGVALLKLIAEYLDEKFVLPDWKPYTLELIKHRSQELFFKITKHYGDSRNFLYRKY